MPPLSVDDVLSAAQRLGWPPAPWRGGSIVGIGAWREAAREATLEELQSLRAHLNAHRHDPSGSNARRRRPAELPSPNREPIAPSENVTKTVTVIKRTNAQGRVEEIRETSESTPPKLQIIRMPKHEPAEWERERDELRAQVASLEAQVRRLATTPTPAPPAPPRAVVSTIRYHCWRAVAGLVRAAAGPVRVVRVDFDQLEREAGDGRSSPATRRLVLEDFSHEAREDREFWLENPDLRELRFEDVAPAAALAPANQPLSSAPAPAVRVASPIGFRPTP